MRNHSFPRQLIFLFTLLCFFLFFQTDLRGQASAHALLIHEAYLPAITELVPQQAIPLKPPLLINENIPIQIDPLTQWIHGYWDWLPGFNDFMWINGIWRRPPPNQRWTEGYWKEFLEGWIYIHGFWGPPLAPYLRIPPPASLQDPVTLPPAANVFWDPGFWIYASEFQDYIWIEGEWRQIDPNWILVPAHYQWREQGYIFIPGFWDWPLEVRGQVFRSLDTPPDEGYETMTLSMEPLPSQAIVQQLLPYYPDYLYFYYHYLYFHPEAWSIFLTIPPWLQWQSWWILNWNNQWALWWWYTHPGYPAPMWMTPEISHLLPPPSVAMILLTRGVVPPPIVTPNGILTANELLSFFSEEQRRRGLPIFTKDSLWRLNTSRRVENHSSTLRPTGAGLTDIARRAPSAVPLLPFKQAEELSKWKYSLPKEQIKKLLQNYQSNRLPPKPQGTFFFQPLPTPMMKRQRAIGSAPFVEYTPVEPDLATFRQLQRIQVIKQKQLQTEESFHRGTLNQVREARKEQQRLYQNDYPYKL